MKKFIFVCFLAIGGLISSNDNLIQSNLTTELSSKACQYGQCSAKVKSTGVRCKNCCQQGSSTCWSHR